jgi:hypothetical protein
VSKDLTNAERVANARAGARAAAQGTFEAVRAGDTKRAHANAAGAWRAALWATEALIDEMTLTRDEPPKQMVDDEAEAWCEAMGASEDALGDHFHRGVKEALAVAQGAPSAAAGRETQQSIDAATAMIGAHTIASETDPEDPDAVPDTLTVAEKTRLLEFGFMTILGTPPREADTQLILAMTGGTESTEDISHAIGSFLWDHWMGEPESPTEGQVVKLIKALVPFTFTDPPEDEPREKFADLHEDKP